MPPPDADYWLTLLRRTLQAYDDDLLRAVSARLVRPRNHWPADELIDRAVAAAANPAIIDRRLKEMEAPARRILALIGHSRQPCWAMGNLVEMVMTLGHPDGVQPLRDLVETGLLYPAPAVMPAADAEVKLRIRSFHQWLVGSGAGNLFLFAPPQVTARAIGEDFGLPDLSETASAPAATAQETDGLEWILLLAVLWQQVSTAPLRRALHGGYFKRDHDRLAGDPMLNGPAADAKVELPDTGLLLAALGEAVGLLESGDGESHAGAMPPSWTEGLAAALQTFFAVWPCLRSRNPRDGWCGPEIPSGNPFASAGLLALVLLARLPQGAFALVDDVQAWIHEHHPYWFGEDQRPSRQKPWMDTFLMGVAYTLRLVQVSRDADGKSLVRLSPTGRWLLGVGEAPVLESVYTQTLTVQPNLEIIAFRQGLTPGLVAALGRFAAWKSLGAACTLQLEPESVYRALEAGESFESIRQTLEQHSTRGLPETVLDLLRTWSNKRDRITVFPAATLLEFDSAADLNEALSRGVPGQRIAETLAMLPNESAIDYRHFRLIGTRDYAIPPERCATVEPDGTTLVVDATRSDLLLETELPRFAEPLPNAGSYGRRYRLTPASLSAARNAGLSLPQLETWFQQRAGQPLSPAARLLMTAGQAPPGHWRRHLVFHVPVPEMADGLMQWPATRALIGERLGPTAVSVAEENAASLRELCQELGIAWNDVQS